MSRTPESEPTPWRDADLMEDLYHQQGLSLKEIADRFGCSRTTIDTWMDKHGVDRRPPGDSSELSNLGEELERLYLDEGRSGSEISTMLGYSPDTIWRWLHIHGIPVRDNGFQAGKEHLNWKDGETPRYYGATWNQQREKRIELDDGTCQACGMSDDQHQAAYGRDIEVHHIVPFTEHDDSEQANRLQNLITLCHQCHMVAEEKMLTRNEIEQIEVE